MITFNEQSLKTLDKIGGTHFLALCVRLAINLEEDSCKLKIDGFTVRELSSAFGISVNKVNRLINLAKDIGVILKFEVVTGEMFLYNPSIAYKGTIPTDTTIKSMFGLTLFNNCTEPELINYFKPPVLNMDNIYILSQPDSEGAPIYKIGYSKNIQARLKSYFTTNPSIKLIATFNYVDALTVEKELHKKYTSIHGNEWYDLETMTSINEDYEFNLDI